MIDTNSNSILIQIVISLIALAGFAGAFFIGTRMKMIDRGMSPFIFVVGCVFMVVAIAVGASYILSAFLFIGAALMGLSIGLNTKREA